MISQSPVSRVPIAVTSRLFDPLAPVVNVDVCTNVVVPYESTNVVVAQESMNVTVPFESTDVVVPFECTNVGAKCRT